MLKKFFCTAIVSLIICAGVKVEAEEIFIGTAPITDYKCYVLTDTINRDYEDHLVIISATMKTVDCYGDENFIDYKFYAIDGDTENVQFTNSDGAKGMANSFDAPIEWEMYLIIRDY